MLTTIHATRAGVSCDVNSIDLIAGNLVRLCFLLPVQPHAFAHRSDNSKLCYRGRLHSATCVGETRSGAVRNGENIASRMKPEKHVGDGK